MKMTARCDGRVVNGLNDQSTGNQGDPERGLNENENENEKFFYKEKDDVGASGRDVHKSRGWRILAVGAFDRAERDRCLHVE